MTNKLDLSIDASGKVILSDDKLNQLESFFICAKAGAGTNSGDCDATTNRTCTNSNSCTGSSNTVSCMNSRACITTNDNCQSQ